jgi:hypothetical protein
MSVLQRLMRRPTDLWWREFTVSTQARLSLQFKRFEQVRRRCIDCGGQRENNAVPRAPIDLLAQIEHAALLTENPDGVRRT